MSFGYIVGIRGKGFLYLIFMILGLVNIGSIYENRGIGYDFFFVYYL